MRIDLNLYKMHPSLYSKGSLCLVSKEDTQGSLAEEARIDDD